MSILRAILAGERDCIKLAQLKHPQIKSSTQQIAKALEGDSFGIAMKALEKSRVRTRSYPVQKID